MMTKMHADQHDKKFRKKARASQLVLIFFKLHFHCLMISVLLFYYIICCDFSFGVL